MAISCLMVFTGIDGWMTSTLGLEADSVIGAKSLTGSKGSVEYSVGLIPWVLMVVRNRL